MKAGNSVFATICTSPCSVSELKDALDFSDSGIYHAISALRHQKLADISRQGKEVVVKVANDYRAQKRKEVFIKAMANGVDPEFLIDDNTQRVWSELRAPRRLDELEERVGLSYSTVYRICKGLRDAGLVKEIKKRPLVLHLKESHPINRSLEGYLNSHDVTEIPYLGHLPTKLMYGRPSDVEQVLFEKKGKGISLPGYRSKGEETTWTIKTLDHITPASVFLEELKQPEGAEAFCPHILRLTDIDYDELYELAKKENMVNEVGCYLNIVRDIRPQLVPAKTIKKFLSNSRQQKREFYRKEKKHGKDPQLKQYERSWNLDLYLDYDAVKRNVEAVT